MSTSLGGDAGAGGDPYVHLPENVRKLLRETGTKVVNKDDLEALSRVSVRDLAKYYNTISEGQNAHQAITDLIRRKREQVRNAGSDHAPANESENDPERAEPPTPEPEEEEEEEIPEHELKGEEPNVGQAQPEDEQQGEAPNLGQEQPEDQPEHPGDPQRSEGDEDHERTDSLDDSVISDKECLTPPHVFEEASALPSLSMSPQAVSLLAAAAGECGGESHDMSPSPPPPEVAGDADAAGSEQAADVEESGEAAAPTNDKASEDGNGEGQTSGPEAVPTHTIDIALLPDPKWLRPRFDVIKYDPKAKLFSKKIRTWEIDFLGNAFRNMDRKGRVKKEFTPNKLLQIERHASHNYKLRLLFFGANHSYELEFTSIADRERFYECACAFRPKLYVWCPDIVLPGAERSKTQLCGTTTALVSDGKGKKPVEQEFTGSTKINATLKPGENISIFCCTWNMDSKPPPQDSQSFRAVLEPGRHDIYALVVQESSFSQDPEEWFHYAQAMLGKEYVILASQSLWDIRLVVITRKRHLIKIVNIQGESKPTGFVNICGNKGGVGIGLRFIETSILFVGCHLASSQERTAVRNTNILEIVDSLKIGNKELDIFSQFHHVFWMGDLNYRVDLPYSEGLQLAEAADVAELLKHDQLKAQIECGNILKDMAEGEITFKPTFKFVPGTLEYDTKKARTPSYTDRILYKSFPGMNAELCAYNCIEDVRTSDHLPVYASFTVECHRPFASVFMVRQEPCQIVFSNLYVTDRPSSDVINRPVLVFYAHFLKDAKDGRPKTDRLPKTANPRWKDNQVPVLTPVTTDREYLMLQHIVIALRDGPERAESTENLLGQAIIPLHHAFGPSPAKFTETLYLHGVKACTLSGSVHIKPLLSHC